MCERRCYMASNYKGYLVKVGNYTIPLELIKTQTYKSAMHGQDLDSYRDSNGTLHREALSNFAPKCEFETIPMMTDSQVNSLMKNIRDNYTNQLRYLIHVYVHSIYNSRSISLIRTLFLL